MDYWYPTSDAAKFVGLSRPTFNHRREVLKFTEQRKGAKTLIPKSELLSLYAKEIMPGSATNLVVTEDNVLGPLFVDEHTLDLRKINVIDAYGIISLVTASASILETGQPLFLILSDSLATRVLAGAGYFSELKRRFKSSVHWNEDGFPNEQKGNKPFLSLHYIGFKGQERKLLDDLVPLLMKQGFTVDLIGYIGWVMGELADNALTHAQGPCYMLMGQFGQANTYLEVAIGDTGRGIHGSLKQKAKYAQLTDRAAFLKAFQSRVTCWPDDPQIDRGKGLSDLLTIAMGNGSILRVDSNDLGISFNFVNGQQELQQTKSANDKSGTRFCLLLINDKFEQVTREVVDSFIAREMKKV